MKRQQSNRWLIFKVNFWLMVFTVYAGGYYADAIELDYPELSVIPKASERLSIEAAREPSKAFWTFLPFQLSALSTLCSGWYAYNVNPSYTEAGVVGLSVGSTWLVISTTMTFFYRPYSKALESISPRTKNNALRDQLIFERMVEKEIKDIASLGRRIKWLSVLSHVGTAVFMISQNKTAQAFLPPGHPGYPGEAARTNMLAFEISSLVFALTPMIFPPYWADVEQEQQNYKKRIYGPLTQTTVLYDQVRQKYLPGMTWSWRF